MVLTRSNDLLSLFLVRIEIYLCCMVRRRRKSQFVHLVGGMNDGASLLVERRREDGDLLPIWMFDKNLDIVNGNYSDWRA